MRAITSKISGKEDTSQGLVERMIYRRGVEAAIWGMPLVNFDAMRQAYFRDAGARYNDVIYWSKPSDWRNQTTTPNHSTGYVMFFVNLKNGPMVIDIPPASDTHLYGTLIDSWTIPMMNVGIQGDDKGKGAKYLLLPPGYKNKVPTDYVTVPCTTYNAYSLLRLITKTHSAEDILKSHDYLKRLKIYPLLHAGSPASNSYIDVSEKLFGGRPIFDSSFYTSLARMVEEEPPLEHDLTMMGELRSLNIGKDLTFQPDISTKAILNLAVDEAHAYMMEGFATCGTYWWDPKRKWRTLVDMDLATETRMSFVKPNSGVQIDQRAYAWFAMFGPVVPPAPHFNLKSYESKNGERLNGSKNYRLHIAKGVPARHFWAVDVYDASTCAFIREAPVVGLDSYNQELKVNADGSIDLYFAPRPPYGKENNWIATNKNAPFFVAFRAYGPEKPILEKTWVLDDIEEVRF